MLKTLISTAFLFVAASAVAPAQGAGTVHVRGVLVSLEGSTLTVGAPLGDQRTVLRLPPNPRVQYVVKTTLAAVRPGTYVGSAAVPQVDGSLRALELQVFPPSMNPRSGSFPYDLTPTSTMTNGTVKTIGSAKVDKIDAKTVTVGYDGGEKTIVIPPDAPIVTYEPADVSALVKGARVNIFATRNPDGSLIAASIGVGKNGLVPPM